MRPRSLPASWKLMSACTLAIASNAASAATSNAVALAPWARTSTSVPSSGRARWRITARPPSSSRGLRGDRMLRGPGHQPVHAVGDVRAAERGAADVGDVRAHVDRVARALADELVAPGRHPHLAAVAFAVGQDLDGQYLAGRVQRDGVVDLLELADHRVDDHAPQHRVALARLD